MGDTTSGTGVANTAPIINTPVASTDAILGDIGNSTAVAMGKEDGKGKNLLKLSIPKLAEELWRNFFPQFKVNIRELTEKSGPSAPVIRFTGWDGWTQSSTEVWIRTKDYKDKDGVVRAGYTCAVLGHEKVHVEQFASGNRGRPKTLEQMLQFELVAYPAGASWLHHKCKETLDTLFNKEDSADIHDIAMSAYTGLWVSLETVEAILAELDKVKAASGTAEKIYEKARELMDAKHYLPNPRDGLKASLTEPELLKALYGY